MLLAADCLLKRMSVMSPSIGTKALRRRSILALYVDVCWRMLTYSSETQHNGAYDSLQVYTLTYADAWWRMLTYADVCWRMLTYADVCWRMLTYEVQHNGAYDSLQVYDFCVWARRWLPQASTAMYVSSYCYICVLILLICYMSSYCYVCPHTAMCLASSYCYICVLILLYMCPHTATSVSSYCYRCVLILLYMCTAMHVSSNCCVSCVLILQCVRILLCI
jgi:hypothetical protein